MSQGTGSAEAQALQVTAWGPALLGTLEYLHLVKRLDHPSWQDWKSMEILHQTRFHFWDLEVRKILLVQFTASVLKCRFLTDHKTGLARGTATLNKMVGSRYEDYNPMTSTQGPSSKSFPHFPRDSCSFQSPQAEFSS